ncbi:MAG: hypothetical protein R3C68_13615, partial [Myxococcota bacterium]
MFRKPGYAWGIGWAALTLWTCSSKDPIAPIDPNPPPPSWHFNRIDNPAGERTLMDLWGRSDGTLFAVGASGLIMHNPITQETLNTPEPVRQWVKMTSPTFANLTAITGVENGALFGLPPEQGEMFAVGWEGTLLHYHPNPDGDPQSDDGIWSLISGPETVKLQTVQKLDPACPDFDGDGIHDDGDASGWIGDAPCTGGQSSGCDDNCTGKANGPLRPLVDLNADGCLSFTDNVGNPGPPFDGPDPNVASYQQDNDNDGIGDTCVDASIDPATARDLNVPLFDIWVQQTGDQLTAVAVGGDGAIVSFRGASAGGTPLPGALPVTDAAAWIAQRNLAYRFDVENAAACQTTPRGEVCTGTGRLPPSCPAQCSPARTQCSCPPAMGQCCDANASTGVGCADGSCPPAGNACDAGLGLCRTLCPTCFRRLERTLRGVVGGSGFITAVGDHGNLFVLNLSNPEGLIGVWEAPTCPATPPPLDQYPLLVGVAVRGSAFRVVGSGGSVFDLAPGGGGCIIASRSGSPPGFLSNLMFIGSNRSYAVGDRGLLLDIGGSGNIEVIDTQVQENLFG